MIDSVLKLLVTGLSLWEHKDARKYLDKTIKLRKQWYEEYNKDTPDNATLDNIELELRLISEAFSSQVGVAYTRD